MLKFIQLYFVVLVLIDLSENCIHILVGNWEVDFVESEKLFKEFSEFFSVKETAVVLIELTEVGGHFTFKMVLNVLEVCQLTNDSL